MGFSEQDTCKYIRDTSAQLARLSDEVGLDVLSYLLSMAQLSADNRLVELLNPPSPKFVAFGPIPDRAQPAESPLPLTP